MALKPGQICPVHNDGIIDTIDLKPSSNGNVGWFCNSISYINSNDYHFEHWCATKLNSVAPIMVPCRCGDICPYHNIDKTRKIGFIEKTGWKCGVFHPYDNYTHLGGIPMKIDTRVKYYGLDEWLPEIKVDLSKDDRFPHTCLLCGNKCYIGLGAPEHPTGVECKKH